MNKRLLLITALAVLMLVGVLLSMSSLKPVWLTCEHQTDPSVVDDVHPRLSWINEPIRRSTKGECQTAYRIQVATTLKALKHGDADLWDTGKMMSDESNLLPYDGKTLTSGQTCWWRVKVWDRRGRSRWSAPSQWTMGILDAAQWKAQWIAAPWEHGAAPLFRQTVQVTKPVKRARAYVSALGWAEMYIDGQRVGDDYFSPGLTNAEARPQLALSKITIDPTFTDYRVLYLAYDVTASMQQGEHCLSALLGEGFYNNVTGHWCCPFGRNALLIQMEVEYADGTTATFVTDESWKVRPSAIVMNNVYGGEHYDARREDNDEWTAVELRPAPQSTMTAQNGPTDRLREVLEPVSLTQQDDGSWLVDFGREVTGWIRFKNLKGEAGDTLRVRYICESPLGSHQYIFKGSSQESWAPRFTWFVFSKAVIESPCALTADNLTAEFICSDVEQTATFETSDSLLNRINAIWCQSQLDNMHMGVASDCPHRERSPYTGDGQVACVTVMHNFDASAFYQKWIRDMRDVQNPSTGYVPNSAPWQPGCGGGVGWGAAMTIMPWEYYVHYGDRRLLEVSYPAMKAQLEWMLTWRTPEGTMRSEAKTLLGDADMWLRLGDWAPAYGLPNDELVHTFFLWRCADYASKAAAVLGMYEDASRYSFLARDVRSAFHRKFFDAEWYTYGDFGSNVLALAMGAPPASCRGYVAEALRYELENKYNSHLNTGIFGTQYLFETLAANGMQDLAGTIIRQTDFPSYGHWIAQGATTTWEQWNGQDSRNHPMFGGGLTWFYRCLAGVRADASAPGYRHFTVAPQPVEGIDKVKYSTRTPYGTLAVAYEICDGKFVLRVTVPVGCTATVTLPNTFSTTLQQGSYTLNCKV